MSVIQDGGGLERCPDCFHTISIDGLNDEECECYCHMMTEEMQEWLSVIEERRDWYG